MGFSTLEDSGGNLVGFICSSQSLSGWDGVFNPRALGAQSADHTVAIPFRVGWGFQQCAPGGRGAKGAQSRNPFQGGMGFSTAESFVRDALRNLGRNPFQGGMGFSTRKVC